MGIMAVTFFFTFTVGDWIKGYFELGIDWVSELVQRGLTALNAGICRKVIIFMLVGIAHVIDVNVIATGSVLRMAVIFFYLSNEGVSLLENAGHLGLPIPVKLKVVLEQLHDRAEKDESN